MCPYKFPADDWKDEITEWPPLQYHDLYHYLIKTPRLFSPEAMENYKSLDAYRFFVAGWVQTIKHIQISSVFLAKCFVRRSYRTSGVPHEPW